MDPTYGVYRGQVGRQESILGLYGFNSAPGRYFYQTRVQLHAYCNHIRDSVINADNTPLLIMNYLEAY